jgi:hypothetical protein
MAFKKQVKPEEKVDTADILADVLKKPTDRDFLSTVIDSQTEDFPSVSEVSVSEAYVDPFSIPKWCDQKRYSFAWANIRDDIERHRVLEAGFFKIVNKMSSCIKGKILERDFRDHGAVERQGMFLVFRPKDLDEKLRTLAVLRHGDMVESVAAGKSGQGYEITHSKSKEDRGSGGLEVFAYEEAGEVGLKSP